MLNGDQNRCMRVMKSFSIINKIGLNQIKIQKKNNNNSKGDQLGNAKKTHIINHVK